jgi:hypothetical protein
MFMLDRETTQKINNKIYCSGLFISVVFIVRSKSNGPSTVRHYCLALIYTMKIGVVARHAGAVDFLVYTWTYKKFEIEQRKCRD